MLVISYLRKKTKSYKVISAMLIVTGALAKCHNNNKNRSNKYA